MIHRCELLHHAAYANYGGRGIRVCDRWKSFEAFFADMGPKPENMDLDRIDNNGNYEPSNCRWLSRKENTRNRRTNHRLTFDGQTLTLAAWSEKTGILANTLHYRLEKLGWSVSKSLTTPTRIFVRGGSTPGSIRRAQKRTNAK